MRRARLQAELLRARRLRLRLQCRLLVGCAQLFDDLADAFGVPELHAQLYVAQSKPRHPLTATTVRTLTGGEQSEVLRVDAQPLRQALRLGGVLVSAVGVVGVVVGGGVSLSLAAGAAGLLLRPLLVGGLWLLDCHIHLCAQPPVDVSEELIAGARDHHPSPALGADGSVADTLLPECANSAILVQVHVIHARLARRRRHTTVEDGYGGRREPIDAQRHEERVSMDAPVVFEHPR